jgi:heptosyltransferase-2
MKKILIVGPAWIGDMVMAQGLFKVLKQCHPDSIIDVIAPDWTRPLLDRMPEIHQTHSLPFKHGEFAIFKRFALGRILRAQNYSEAIVLPNSWKSAIIPFAAKIPKRTGWLGEIRVGLLNNIYYLDKQKLPLMIERFTALAQPSLPSEKRNLENPKLIIDINSRKTALEKYNLNTNKKIIALCPGAEFGPSKRWPENYYAEVANKLLEKDFQIWLMGSQKDRAVTDKINELTHNQCKNLAGNTSLAEAIDLLSLSSLVITNDSGLMHIAAALDLNIIALYGSTDPGFTPPLSNKAKILSIELECRPCFKRECPLKHHKCMNDLFPSIVLKSIEQCAF